MLFSSLSPRDREPLDDFALVGFDVESLARRRALSVSAALEWALAPHIAKAVDFIRAGLASLNGLRCQLARERIITSLSKALDAASSPNEVCRVANALIRICLAGSAAPRHERAASSPPPPRAPAAATAAPQHTPAPRARSAPPAQPPSAAPASLVSRATPPSAAALREPQPPLRSDVLTVPPTPAARPAPRRVPRNPAALLSGAGAAPGFT